MHDWFERQVAPRLTALAGSVWALLAAGLLIAGWLVTGPLFGFSDTWQLVINTTTTVVTFLMVFVIQASTNRESKAMQIKLDELIRSMEGARNELIQADKGSGDALQELEAEFEDIAKEGGVAVTPLPAEQRRTRRRLVRGASKATAQRRDVAGANGGSAAKGVNVTSADDERTSRRRAS